MPRQSLLDVAVQSAILVAMLSVIMLVYRTVRGWLFGNKMSQAEMVEGLKRIIADPATPDDLRSRAQSQLSKLEPRKSGLPGEQVGE